ncbi:sigma factor-like helix-turn-helix DNA-binding protein [Amycolatopsis halotolerans]|uniref:Sigma factor-like helix-turn-helix DNA-binding protein n=1 Tax=Amycolatopsis halotolerans TaxID=330083 RepID=A0ABV7QDV8_9PSEU
MTAAPHDAHLRALPSWLSGDPSFGERMVSLGYRVARNLGSSSRVRKRVWRRVTAELAASDVAGPDYGRLARDRILASLHTEFPSARQTAKLDSAAREAVLLDELALLPPRQRFALWATAMEHRSLADIADTTGWTPTQVARLLRTGLRTVGSHTPE